jgi:F0F1-type ATP synthase epsilon subunit
MQLTLVTPIDKKQYAIVWVEIQTPTRNIVIQPGHAPMTIPLEPTSEITFCLKNGKQETVSVTHGIIDINRQVITVWLEHGS